jgi:hypothetical protein
MKVAYRARGAVGTGQTPPRASCTMNAHARGVKSDIVALDYRATDVSAEPLLHALDQM